MSFLVAALGVSALSTGITSLLAGKERKRADREQMKYEAMLSDLEANRQDITNPYADVTNPYSNLGVATGASEFQAEETDIALANTLNTLNSFGYGAGGATSLAQEAARSKMNISNNIQGQEMRNAELRARGQQQMESLMGQGKQFSFNAQENRENQLLSRYAGLAQQNQALSAGYRQQQIGALSQFGSNLASSIGGFGMGND